MRTIGPLRRLTAAGLAALAVAAGACSSEPATTSTAPVAQAESGPRRMRVGVAFSPKAAFAIETADAFVLTTIGVAEPMVRTDFEGRAQPGLATAWEQVDDRSWRFRLREKVSFHNGQPLDAAAATTALQYVIASATPPRGLQGATVEAADAMTVVVRAAQPDPVLPLRMSSPNASLLAPAAYAAGGVPRPMAHGTGPFELVSERPGEQVGLRANAGYWGGKPALDEVEVRFIPDPATRATAVRAGEIDLAQGIPASQVPTLRSAPSLKLVSAPEPRTTSLYMNTKSDKLADRRVREALSLAIDRRALAEGVLDGSGIPAAGVFRPDSEWSQNRLKVTPANPERAASLLAEAGFAKGKLNVNLWTYTDRAGLEDVATAVQAMLAKAGVTATIRVSAYAAVEPDVLAGNFDLFILSRSYLTDTNDPGGFLASDFGCKGSYNLNHYCDAELDALIGQLSTATEPARRFDLFRKAEDRLVSQFVGAPLVHDQVTTAMRTNVDGYRADPLGRYLLTPQLAVKG